MQARCVPAWPLPFFAQGGGGFIVHGHGAIGRQVVTRRAAQPVAVGRGYALLHHGVARDKNKGLLQIRTAGLQAQAQPRTRSLKRRDLGKVKVALGVSQFQKLAHQAALVAECNDHLRVGHKLLNQMAQRRFVGDADQRLVDKACGLAQPRARARRGDTDAKAHAAAQA